MLRMISLSNYGELSSNHWTLGSVGATSSFALEGLRRCEVDELELFGTVQDQGGSGLRMGNLGSASMLKGELAMIDGASARDTILEEIGNQWHLSLDGS